MCPSDPPYYSHDIMESPVCISMKAHDIMESPVRISKLAHDIMGSRVRTKLARDIFVYVPHIK